MTNSDSVRQILKEVATEISLAGFPQKYNTFKNKTEPLYKTEHGILKYHSNKNCFLIRETKPDVKLTTSNFSDFRYCTLCSKENADVARLRALQYIASYSKHVRNALTYVNSSPNAVNRVITKLNTQKSWAEEITKDLLSYPLMDKDSLGLTRKALGEEVNEIVEEINIRQVASLKHLRSLLVTDEVKNSLNEKAKKYLNGFLSNTSFDETMVLVGAYQIRLKSYINDVHSVYAIKTNTNYFVSLMPRYVYEYYQRICYRAGGDVGWIGYVDGLENINESIIETAASLWDPNSSDGLQSLDEAFFIAKNI